MLINKIIFYYLYTNIIYYFCSLFVFILDCVDKLINYKIQKTNYDTLVTTYNKSIPIVMLNTFIFLVPVYVIGALYECNYEGDYVMKKSFTDLLLGFLLTDIFFYLLHRMFHLDIFYRYHKKHHEIIAPIGVSALYMSPIDLYFGNILPVMLPIFILGFHPYTIYMWICVVIVNTICTAHSGFRWISDFHDYHHSMFTKNYGANVFMDRLFGTYFEVKN